MKLFLRTYQYPLMLFLLIRIWTLAWASWSLAWWHVDIPAYERFYYGISPLDTTPLGWLWSPWQRWDSIWYVHIAEFGYAPDNFTTAFFPLYPLLIRAVITLVPINGVAAGLGIATVAGCGAFVLLYHLARGEFGEAVARRALLYLATFPSAYYFFAAYTEALFLFLALAAWWQARAKRWWAVALFGALVALTRPQGMLIFAPLALIFYFQYRRAEIKFPSAFYLLLIPASALGFFYYLFQIVPSATAWFQIEGLWRQFAPPWQPLWQSAVKIFTSGFPDVAFFNALALTLTLLFLVLMGQMVWERRLAEATYLAIILFPPLFTVANFTPYFPLASLLRFLVVAFPGFIALGRIKLAEPLPKVFAILMLGIQTLMLILFTHWLFAE